MQGLAGRAPGGNYIIALDSETGKEVWRFNTIPRPGQPGGDSWNGSAGREARRSLHLDVRQL